MSERSSLENFDLTDFFRRFQNLSEQSLYKIQFGKSTGKVGYLYGIFVSKYQKRDVYKLLFHLIQIKFSNLVKCAPQVPRRTTSRRFIIKHHIDERLRASEMKVYI